MPKQHNCIKFEKRTSKLFKQLLTTLGEHQEKITGQPGAVDPFMAGYASIALLGRILTFCPPHVRMQLEGAIVHTLLTPRQDEIKQ